MDIDKEKCIGCGYCVRDCPVAAVRLVKKKAVINDHGCTHCGVCMRVCESDAVVAAESMPAEAIECDACPIKCWIQPGFIGACHRYRNEAGKLVRLTRLHSFGDVKNIVGPEPKANIRKPLITAIGAGTTYPDCKPAPHIVKARRRGVDVVTVVTEVPLSYSSIIVKIDTDIPIGKEGDRIFVGKREVGMVETEQYGSKMLHIGGVNRMTGKNGFVIARTITDIANRKRVKLKIEKGSRLEVQVGYPPIIDGQEATRMRVGCGSATMGLFAPLLKAAADEVIIIDSHITGQMSRHVAGVYAGARPTGIRLKFSESTPGRYFGDHGNGWGGTSIINPADVISSIDMQTARPGMTILITETTGQNGAMFKIGKGGTLTEMSLSKNAKTALKAIADSCQPSRVSAIYTAGAGGSARAGVTRYPIKLTRAVHAGQAHLTVGGSPGFIMPGGGISFMVDVERVKSGSFYWTPTPATICPLEYTMELKDYHAMGGHIEALKPFSAKKPNQK
ncbi:MAG: 4Fe-4S dicluster domain-containing protein [Deltaproteobacteria bacterium]|jgi:Fe-S-cluster-containing hydrogenase component 2|nr:4Fe-4S dicluster domain-containing protein [Deltaproteobacteria bacterium]MBW2469433.1 4Fe-4S dicluster domain-containing protein [Deltaproteobacteria bacterium]MBW2486215.1 4Fe-4S dicluster domain-containing protein [Deltaproteobacteria bacterium]